MIKNPHKKRLGRKPNLESRWRFFGSPSSNIFRADLNWNFTSILNHAPVLGDETILSWVFLPLDWWYERLCVQTQEGGLFLDQQRPKEFWMVCQSSLPAGDRTAREWRSYEQVPRDAEDWHEALDIQHKNEDKDLVTGLKLRANAGRPNWNNVFTKLREEEKGQVSVFYCRNTILAKTLRSKCE